MTDFAVSCERDGHVAVYRATGVFDRAAAWALRQRMEREPARELLLDFTGVRDWSERAVAVLGHGLTLSHHRVSLRGFTPRQVRIFQYCGVAVDELLTHGALGTGERTLPA